MILKQNELIQHIERGKLSPIYFFYGENDFFIKEACDLIKNKLLGKNADPDQYHLLYSDEVSIDELIGMASTYPFIPGTRLIVYKGIETESKNNKISTRLLSYLKHPMSDTYIIMKGGDKVDARTTFFKAIAKEAVITRFYQLFENQIPGWIIKKADYLGFKITTRAAQLLIEIVGVNLYQLDGELQKLSLYSGDKKKVDVEDIKKTIGLVRVYTIFELVNCMGNKNAAKSLLIIQQLVDYGMSPLAILSMIFWYFNRLLQVKSMVTEGASSDQIAKKIGINKLFLKEYLTHANLFSDNKINMLFPLFLDTDISLKSGVIKQSNLLESLVFKICFDA